MHLKKNNNLFTKGMYINFLYNGKHYVEKVKNFTKTYLETENGEIFLYANMFNCKVGYMPGEKVKVNVRDLFFKRDFVEYGYIDSDKKNDNQKYYYDLYSRGNLVCEDGDICEIEKVEDDYVLLKNTNEKLTTRFVLTLKEADVCCYANVEKEI